MTNAGKGVPAAAAPPVANGGWRDLMGGRLPGLVRQLIILGLRSANTVAKFLLALYTARYLGLADLGVYGLLSGAATCLPATIGFGLTAWVVRRLVDLPRSAAMPLMVTRLAVVLAMHAVLQPAAWLVNEALGAPVNHFHAALIGAILLFENLTADACAMLIARRRVLSAEALFFVRAGLWPLPVMVLGVFWPQWRTLDALMIGWLAGLAMTVATLAVLALATTRRRHIGLAVRETVDGARASVALYTHDLCLALNLYLDRFLISMFLGMELTGVYTFFWSFANVAHTLALYGVLTPQIAKLVAAASDGYSRSFVATEKHMIVEIGLWAGLICVSISIALPFLLPFVGRPELAAHLGIFWIVVAGTLLRIAADAYGYILYALHRDGAVAKTSLGATVASATLNVLLIPSGGIVGAAAAYVLTFGGQCAVRIALTRRKQAAL